MLPQGSHRWRGSEATLWDFSLERVTGRRLWRSVVMEGGEMCAPGVPWGTCQENLIKIILESTFAAQHCKAGQRSTIHVLHRWKLKKKEKKSENGLISKLRSPIPSETLCHRGETVELSAVEVTWRQRVGWRVTVGSQLITEPRINLWTLVVDQLLIGCSKHIECFFLNYASG